MWLEVLSGEDAGRVLEVDRPLVLGRVAGRRPRDPRRARLAPPRRADARSTAACGCATSTPRTGRWSTARRRTSVLLPTAARRSASATCGSRCWRTSRRSPARRSPSRSARGARGRPRAPRGRWSRGWSRRGTRRGRRSPTRRCAVAGRRDRGGGGARADRRARRARATRIASPHVVRDVAPATLRIEARSGGRAGTGSAAAGCSTATTGCWSPPRTWSTSGERLLRRRRHARAAAQVVAAAPCEDLAVLRVRARLAGGGARRSATPSRARRCSRSASRRARSRASPPPSTRGVVSAARTAFRDPAPDVPALPRRDPHRHRARSRLLRRPARRPRRPRRRDQRRRAHASAPTTGRCRAPTTRSPPAGRATCSTCCAAATRSPGSAPASAIRRAGALAPRGLPPGLRVPARCRARAPPAPGLKTAAT